MWYEFPGVIERHGRKWTASIPAPRRTSWSSRSAPIGHVTIGTGGALLIDSLRSDPAPPVAVTPGYLKDASRWTHWDGLWDDEEHAMRPDDRIADIPGLTHAVGNHPSWSGKIIMSERGVLQATGIREMHVGSHVI